MPRTVAVTAHLTKFDFDIALLPCLSSFARLLAPSRVLSCSRGIEAPCETNVHRKLCTGPAPGHNGVQHTGLPRLGHDPIKLNRDYGLAFCLSMILSENRFPLFGIMFWGPRHPRTPATCRRLAGERHWLLIEATLIEELPIKPLKFGRGPRGAPAVLLVEVSPESFEICL
jgi:hypothetical protein